MDTRVEGTALHTYGTTVESSQSAISWGPIIGGAGAAAATSLILVALGSGLGLASVRPWSYGGLSTTAFTVAAAVWLIITQWGASAVGGYLTGRLRTKWVETHNHEVFFRDTAHGFITWALATLIAVFVFVSSATLAAGGVLAASSTSSGSGGANSSARGEAPGTGYEVDLLFRGMGERSAAVADPRPEAERIMAAGLANGGVSPADRSYLAGLVSSRTGISRPEALERVDKFIADSKAAAERARKASSAAAIFTALSMVIGAFIACAAAALGGRERDTLAAQLR
ncbi:MAG: hypothetical protein JO361_10440 [Gammaproteobacteria bacterium]|nr:hypothetical protein [Gammaproteobacteria bacterium]